MNNANAEERSRQLRKGALRMRILIVDDNKLLLKILTRTFQNLGATVTWFDDSNDAISQLRQVGAEFDAVISDYEMKENPDGCSVLRVAHESGVPVLALCTGREIDDFAKEDLEFFRKIDAMILLKPLEPRDCATLLESCNFKRRSDGKTD